MAQNIILNIMHGEGDENVDTFGPLDPFGIQKQAEALSMQAELQGKVLVFTASLEEFPEDEPADDADSTKE